MTRVALDSNILIYFAGVVRVAPDEAKVERVRALVEQLGAVATLVAPAQALGELFVVLERSGVSPAEARQIMLEFADTFDTAPSDVQTMRAAADLVVDHRLQFWDALIVTAAVEARCTMLLSEDMQHGFVVRGMTIVDPLADDRHPRLAALLD